MTTPTKEQCAKLARECGCFFEQMNTVVVLQQEELHAFAIKVLAEKELEVLKLRDALDGLLKAAKYSPRKHEEIEAAFDALSTPPSTEALDEYVATRMAESDEHFTDQMYRAWHKIGADVAGLNWSDFVAAIETESNQLDRKNR